MIKDINIILALDKNYGLGYNNKLSWNIKEELQLFKSYTENSIVIVGKNTYLSLPKLNNRIIFVLTKDIYPDFDIKENVYIFSTFENALNEAIKRDKKIFVIGGKMLYEYVLSKNEYKDRIIIYLSFIDKEYKCDIFLDKDKLNGFEIINNKKYEEFSHNTLIYNKYSEWQYLNIMKEILLEGEIRNTRNSVVISSFNKHLKFDLRQGFPLLTTKKMFIKGIIEELLFFLRGETDTKILENKNINIWKGNTSKEFLDNNGFSNIKEGNMGLMYGFQWRHFNGFYNKNTLKSEKLDLNIDTNLYITPLFDIDQLKYVINEIKTNPTSRRILLTSYNPSQVNEGVLYPCHSVILQFYVSNDNMLDMFCYNRSSDVFLGLPFNIASSSLLLLLISKICNLQPRYFNLSLGDIHIYNNHKESVLKQIERIPFIFPLIKLPNISNIEDIENLSFKDFDIINYNYYESIKINMIA